MILINMFFAIITGAQAVLSEEIRTEEMILKAKVGNQANLGLFGGAFRWVRTIISPGLMHEDKDATIFDSDHATENVRHFLRHKGDLRMAESIHKRVLHGEKIKAKDISELFHGDLAAAMEFVGRLHKKFGRFVDSEPETVEEKENMEQDEIKELRYRLSGIQAHLDQVNNCLSSHLEKTVPKRTFQLNDRP